LLNYFEENKAEQIQAMKRFLTDDSVEEEPTPNLVKLSMN